MILKDAETELSASVYAATKLLEDLEAAGLIDGNGHHARQRIAEMAVDELRSRWRGGTPSPSPTPPLPAAHEWQCVACRWRGAKNKLSRALGAVCCPQCWTSAIFSYVREVPIAEMPPTK